MIDRDTYSEALGTTAGVAATDDVVESIRHDCTNSVYQRVQEAKRREALRQAGVVDERDDAANGRPCGGGTADLKVHATAVDPEELALGGNIWVGLERR